jgi:hypothetical protein
VPAGTLDDDAWDDLLSFELAQSLYAQALNDPAKRDALLGEAGSLLDSTVPEVKQAHDVRRMRQWVESALHGKVAGGA